MRNNIALVTSIAILVIIVSLDSAFNNKSTAQNNVSSTSRKSEKISEKIPSNVELVKEEDNLVRVTVHFDSKVEFSIFSNGQIGMTFAAYNMCKPYSTSFMDIQIDGKDMKIPFNKSAKSITGTQRDICMFENYESSYEVLAALLSDATTAKVKIEDGSYLSANVSDYREKYKSLSVYGDVLNNNHIRRFYEKNHYSTVGATLNSICWS